MKRTIALLAIIAVFPTYLVADPSPPIRRLMSEPVSMLDWGMELMNRDLNEGTRYRLERLGVVSQGDFDKSAVNVTYDYGRDTIQVFMLMPFSATFKPPAKEMCRMMIDAIRADLGYLPELKTPITTWTSYFIPNGYTSNEQKDKELSEAIPKRVSIKATVTKKPNIVNCNGMLTEKTVSFEE
jgi:hypothetical protein